MKITLRGLGNEFARIEGFYHAAVARGVRDTAQLIVNDLASKTPVDTGRAQAGWVKKDHGRTSEITNDVPYIEELNNGHSKQAPARFVEMTLLAYGKAVGSLTTTTPK